MAEAGLHCMLRSDVAGFVTLAPGALRVNSRGGARRLCKVVAMEPHAKVPKLDHNAPVVVASHALRVKKLAPEAIVPSRGSALAAGYDLSRFLLPACLLPFSDLGLCGFFIFIFKQFEFFFSIRFLILLLQYLRLGLHDGVLSQVSAVAILERICDAF